MSFQIALTHRQQAWLASVTFTILGALFLFFVPSLVKPEPDADTALFVFRVLGGIFFILGIVGVLWMCGDLYLKYANPARRDEWFWWGNFILGIAGAALFAIPAIFVFPLMLAGYLLRPNALFPPDADPTQNLTLGLIFSIVGLVTLLFLLWAIRTKYRQRPR